MPPTSSPATGSTSSSPPCGATSSVSSATTRRCRSPKRWPSVRGAFPGTRWIKPEAGGVERLEPGRGSEQRLNVVLISIESMGAEFLGAYGDKRGLTPNLDRLAKESLWFSKVYATGNRTVRGLEALSLSLPPTPGQSIVRRPNNANLFTLGSVFEDKGYDAIFAYGGYGYFDNMNAYFEAQRLPRRRPARHPGRAHPVRERVGRRRRAPVRPDHRGDRPREGGGRRAPGVRPRHDHQQSPPLYLPRRAHRHPVRQGPRRRREIHRLRHRLPARAGARAPLVQGHAVRHHRRSRRQRARHGADTRSTNT